MKFSWKILSKVFSCLRIIDIVNGLAQELFLPYGIKEYKMFKNYYFINWNFIIY
jgi:hypothetical protein